jgi:hypothetical protein
MRTLRIIWRQIILQTEGVLMNLYKKIAFSSNEYKSVMPIGSSNKFQNVISMYSPGLQGN